MGNLILFTYLGKEGDISHTGKKKHRSSSTI
jgi:hypothetical protein